MSGPSTAFPTSTGYVWRPNLTVATSPTPPPRDERSDIVYWLLGLAITKARRREGRLLSWLAWRIANGAHTEQDQP